MCRIGDRKQNSCSNQTPKLLAAVLPSGRGGGAGLPADQGPHYVSGCRIGNRDRRGPFGPTIATSGSDSKCVTLEGTVAHAVEP
jgi:hypothetical protein